MFRRWIRRHLPSEESLVKQAWARPFARHIVHPALWALNRRSVSGGVAAGLACGLIPGPLQMLGAAAVAVVFRVNLPIAAGVTVYTNPVTIVPLYVLAIQYGEWLLGARSRVGHPLAPDWDWSSLWDSSLALGQWMWSMGPSLAVGLPALAFTLAVCGYGLTRGGFNLYLRWCKAQRRKCARR